MEPEKSIRKQAEEHTSALVAYRNENPASTRSVADEEHLQKLAKKEAEFRAQAEDESQRARDKALGDLVLDHEGLVVHKEDELQSRLNGERVEVGNH